MGERTGDTRPANQDGYMGEHDQQMDGSGTEGRMQEKGRRQEEGRRQEAENSHTPMSLESRDEFIRRWPQSRAVGFINPLTDHGFKRLWGVASGKKHLISILNTFLDYQKTQINNLIYQNTEQIPSHHKGRRARFDIYCKTDNNHHIVLEMQQQYHKFYRERALLYAAMMINGQVERGASDFNYSKVMLISIIKERIHPRLSSSPKPVQVISLYPMDERKIFMDKLDLVFIDLYNFNLTADELKTDQDKWLFILKNMGGLTEIPEVLREEPYLSFFKRARISTMDKKQYFDYMMEIYDDVFERNLKASILERGMEKGMEKGRNDQLRKFVLTLHERGYDVEAIVNLTGSTREVVEEILRS